MLNDTINANMVEMLVHSMPMHAILKDAKTGKCLDINAAHLTVYGFDKAEDIIGYTVWDMNTTMNKLWLDNATQVEQFDAEVIYTRQPLIKQLRVWLNAHGRIWAHYMSKIPVLNSKGEAIAILGSSHDLTNTLSLATLYQYYCQFYAHRTTAIQMFLRHLNIAHYFHTLPTHAEIMVLVTKKYLPTNKAIATQLKIVEGTVENHINKLMSKLNITPTHFRDFVLGINIAN